MRRRVARTARRGLQPWKVGLAIRVWLTFGWIVVAGRRHPLPELVRRLDRPAVRPVRPLQPSRLSRINYRLLRLGPYRPRCLHRALVHFRLLRLQGGTPELVIGLGDRSTTPDAHAWVELDGVDVGPPPGRSEHRVLARYPVRAQGRPSPDYDGNVAPS